MFSRRFGWVQFVLVLSLFSVSGNAAAQKQRHKTAQDGKHVTTPEPWPVTTQEQWFRALQEPGPIYVGAYICSACHEPEYQDWLGHGHAWMQVHTGGEVPPDDLFDRIGVPLPALPIPDPKDPDGQITWSDVQDIFGHFRDGNGDLLLNDGRYVGVHGGGGTIMPTRCLNCHNTGFDPTGHAYGQTGIQGSWALSGIQCERCHNPGPAMEIPDPQICRDCHSSGDSKFRIPFDPATELFPNHHPEGDEYRRSPHKELGCIACHDPHRSVWKKEGGVKYANPPTDENIGMMCTNCHNKRIRGSMGEIGLVCTDCHMPERSVTGERHTHLFRINTEPIDSADNWRTEKNDSGRDTKYWMNYDGTTAADGDSFLTLDMACLTCHENRSLEELSRSAVFIHRQPGLIDLTINGGDTLQVVDRNTQVSVDFSVYAKDEGMLGLAADWWVICQGPKGWSSWNGKGWKAGLRPWLTGVELHDTSQNVRNAKLTPGAYTYWVQIFASDGSEFFDSVPVYVSKK